MNPSVCTVVILHQTQPFIIHDDESTAYQQLLYSYFGQVYIEHEATEAMERLKHLHNQPTILLLDIDAIPVEYNEQQDDDRTLINTRHITLMISKLTRDLNTLPNYVPLVVCSANDNTDVMLNCIQSGAIDYLLKPFHINVIKTLFLKLHSSRRILNEETVNQQQNTNSDLQSRINKLASQDIHLSKILVDVYALPPRTNHRRSSLSKRRLSELKEKVCNWDFSPFGLDQQDLIHCVYLVFDQVLKLPELYHISITKDQLYDFIIDLANVYHDENPYHNFAHAVDVLQCLFYMLCELGVLPFTNKYHHYNKSSPQSLLRPKDVFALLIAAIGHDAAHPGVNNVFLINSSNPLATVYNDRSVLESLHSMTLFQLLNKHGIDRLIGDSKSDAYKEFRKTVVSSILATDMSLHMEYVTKIKEQATRFKQHTIQDEESERILLCSALIKCADISNVARPFHWGTKWAELLVQEFISQGDLEKELGMPVLPMNDRTKVVMEDSQIGFIKFVALDLFQNVRQVLDEIHFAVDQMQSNLEQWESRKKASEEDEFEIISNSSTTHMMMIETRPPSPGNKRSSSSLDHHYNTNVKRLSIEKSDTTIYHSARQHFKLSTKEDDEYNDQEDDDDIHVRRNVATNPIYCQCSIQ